MLDLLEHELKADDLVNETMAKAQTLDRDQLSDFFVKMSIMSIGVLRGVHGDQFAIDFLKGAINDKNPIKLTAHLKQ